MYIVEGGRVEGASPVASLSALAQQAGNTEHAAGEAVSQSVSQSVSHYQSFIISHVRRARREAGLSTAAIAE